MKRSLIFIIMLGAIIFLESCCCGLGSQLNSAPGSKNGRVKKTECAQF